MITAASWTRASDRSTEAVRVPCKGSVLRKGSGARITGVSPAFCASSANHTIQSPVYSGRFEPGGRLGAVSKLDPPADPLAPDEPPGPVRDADFPGGGLKGLGGSLVEGASPANPAG